jgi:hypothetical protein
MNWQLTNLLQYTAASKTNALDPTAKSLESLSALFKKDPKLVEVLGAPTLSVSDKQQIVQELQKNLGSQDKEGIVKNFLQTLAQNNRLGVLAGVVDKFGVLMGAHRGEVELTVTSATVCNTLGNEGIGIEGGLKTNVRNRPLTTALSAASRLRSTSPSMSPTARSSRLCPRSTLRSAAD